MAYPPGFLFQQPSVSLALHSTCPPLGSGLLLGPRTEEALLGRSSSGSAFAPYSSSSASQRPYGGERRAAAASSSLSSFAAATYDPPSSLSGPLDYHPFGAPGPYPYGDPGYRKNATRDATATLKAWLHEHRKNPYPTKGEKILLAIVTKMTLTQVSTWFANARRRLKKDNKMTWTPRTRSEDEDDEEEEEEEEPGERGPQPALHHPAAVDSCGLMFRDDGGGGEVDRGLPESDCMEVSGSAPVGGPGSTLKPPPHCAALRPPEESARTPSLCKEQTESCSAPCRPRTPPKPKLWSLAEIATSGPHRGGGHLSEGEGAGPPHATPRTAFPRHLYYTSPFIPAYSSFGSGATQQVALQVAPHQLKSGTADA